MSILCKSWHIRWVCMRIRWGKNVTQGQNNQPTNGQGDSGCRKKAKDELLKGEVSRGNNSTKSCSTWIVVVIIWKWQRVNQFFAYYFSVESTERAHFKSIFVCFCNLWRFFKLLQQMYNNATVSEWVIFCITVNWWQVTGLFLLWATG